MAKETQARNELFEFVRKSFSDQELRTLCFRLNIDYDSLRGEGKEAKVRDLIEFCIRRSRILDLTRQLESERPKASLEIRRIQSLLSDEEREGPIIPKPSKGKKNIIIVIAAASVIFAIIVIANVIIIPQSSTQNPPPSTQNPPSCTQIQSSTLQYNKPTASFSPSQKCVRHADGEFTIHLDLEGFAPNEQVVSNMGHTFNVDGGGSLSKDIPLQPHAGKEIVEFTGVQSHTNASSSYTICLTDFPPSLNPSSCKMKQQEE